MTASKSQNQLWHRSFVRRGRITASQKQTLLEYGNELILRSDTVFSKKKVFGRVAPICVEIGYGMGENLIHMAQTYPAIDFIGIDVHAPGTGRIVRECISRDTANLRIYQNDAIEILTNCFIGTSIDCCFILFPDPWPKNKHHKRRMIQPYFVNLLHSVMVRGGRVQVATDWQSYAKQIMATFVNHKGWQKCNSHSTPYRRTITRYEKKALVRDHRIFDYIWEKI